MFKKIVFVAIFVSVFAVLSPIKAEELAVIPVPASGSLSGAANGNSTIFELSFDLSALPAGAQISAASLEFKQTGSSNGILRIINKYDSAVIDSKALSISGNKNTALILPFLKHWLANPSQNQGVFFQASDLEDTTSINIENIILKLIYAIPDDSSPRIIDLFVDQITDNSALIYWQTDEAVTVAIDYGKTSNYTGKYSNEAEPALLGSVLLTDLNAGVSYHFKATFTDLAGNKTESADTVFNTPLNRAKVLGLDADTVDPSVISPPKLTSLELDATSEIRKVKLVWFWYTEQDIDGFIVLRSLNSSNNFEEIRRVGRDTLEFDDSEIEPQNTYYYTVRAFKGDKQSQASDPLALQVPLNTAENIKITPKNEEETVLNAAAIMAAGVIIACSVLYIIYKFIKRAGVRKENKKRRKNLLKDPDYYLYPRSD